jgi:hypothetical protein
MMIEFWILISSNGFESEIMPFGNTQESSALTEREIWGLR